MTNDWEQEKSEKGPASRRVLRGLTVVLVALILIALGSLVFLWSQLRAEGAAVAFSTSQPSAEQAEISTGAAPVPPTEAASPLERIQPADGYALPVAFGDLGPQLLEIGAIDYERFVQRYEQANRPLSEEQKAILQKGSNKPVVFERDNAYFLLNFFWAVGLANQNPLLEQGPMMQFGPEGVGRFASTGGWTLGTRPATEFYSSAPLISLTAEQQARLEEVAQAVYRPCCNNPTAFPDCNHGMAMLGLLELLAAQGATADEMFEAAKYANAYWFPQQMSDVAAYFEATEGLSFAEVDGRQATGRDTFSAAGFRSVRQWLADNGLLEQVPGQGGSCGV